MHSSQNKYFYETIQGLSSTEIYIMTKTIMLYQQIMKRLWNQFITWKLILQKQFQYDTVQNTPDLYMDNEHILTLTSFFLEYGMSDQILKIYSNALELIKQSIKIGQVYLNGVAVNQQQIICVDGQNISVHKAFYTNVIWRYGPCIYLEAQNNNFAYKSADSQLTMNQQRGFDDYNSTNNIQDTNKTDDQITSQQQIEQSLILYNDFINGHNNSQQLISFERYTNIQADYLCLSIVNVWFSVKHFLSDLYVDWVFINNLRKNITQIQVFLQNLLANIYNKQIISVDGKISLASVSNQNDQELLSFFIQSVCNVLDFIQDIIDSEKTFDDILQILTIAHEILQKTNHLDTKTKKQIFQISITFLQKFSDNCDNMLNIGLLAIQCMVYEYQVQAIVQIIINQDLYIGVLKYLVLYQRTASVKIMLLYYMYRLAMTDQYFKNQMQIALNIGEKQFLSYRKRLKAYLQLKSQIKSYNRVIVTFCIVYIDYITNKITDETLVFKYKILQEIKNIHDHTDDLQFIKSAIEYMTNMVLQ